MRNFDRFKKWIRWHIACFMNRYPDTCWADLVCWAVYPELHDFSEIFSIRNSIGQCEAMGNTPYCGKCEASESENCK